MISYALNNNNDLILLNGKFQLNNDTVATAQLIRTRLKTVYNEWFLNSEIGIDYFGKVFIDNYDIAEIESIFKTEILNTTNVKEMIDFNLEINGRDLLIDFRCNTIFENIISEEFNFGFN